METNKQNNAVTFHSPAGGTVCCTEFKNPHLQMQLSWYCQGSLPSPCCCYTSCSYYERAYYGENINYYQFKFLTWFNKLLKSSYCSALSNFHMVSDMLQRKVFCYWCTPRLCENYRCQEAMKNQCNVSIKELVTSI